MRARFLVASASLVALGAIACISQPAFVCRANADCLSENSALGICEANGSCSFYDAACEGTLRRYADGAPGSLASACVSAGARCIDQLAMGTSHSCALRSDGTVWCWGLNSSGQLGDGTTQDRVSPTRVQGLPAGRKATQIAADEGNTCALLDDHTVWCWGLDDAKNLGQCGASRPPYSPAPAEVPTWTPNAQMPGAPACDASTPFTATQIALGGEHACAIGTDAQLYCWGENAMGAQGGQCGQDPAIFDDVPGPLPVAFAGAVQVECGDEYSCVLKDENSVWCFGANDLHELGNGDTNASFTPVNVSGISDAKTLALDDETPCIVTTAGALLCWGNGTSGIFGADLNDNVAKATRIATIAQAYAGGTAETLCVTQPDGTLQCFGANDKGQCGVGASTPNVTAPTNAQLVTVAGVAIGADHTCATTTDGSLWCWGADDSGQLGDGQTSPTIVTTPKRIDFPCP